MNKPDTSKLSNHLIFKLEDLNENGGSHKPLVITGRCLLGTESAVVEKIKGLGIDAEVLIDGMFLASAMPNQISELAEIPEIADLDTPPVRKLCK